MAHDKAPAYQWYPKDFDTDEAVRLMSYEQQGMYRKLLDHQWLEGSIPGSVEHIAALLHVPAQRFRKLWPAMATKFFDRGDGRLLNGRLERQRSEQHEYAAGQSARGKKGAAALWRKHQSANGASIDSPKANDSSSSSTATASSKREEVPPNARSGRPIFRGQRLTVFEWMLDDCIGTLGPHMADFDLHEWFFALDQQALESGLVIPKRDGGAWLQAQLVAEAQRRGLPLRLAQAGAQKAIHTTTIEDDAAAVLEIVRRRDAAQR